MTTTEHLARLNALEQVLPQPSGPGARTFADLVAALDDPADRDAVVAAVAALAALYGTRSGPLTAAERETGSRLARDAYRLLRQAEVK